MVTLLESLVSDGTVALIALAVLGVEVAALLILRRKGKRVADLAANAVSGMLLILALRSSLVGYGPAAISTFLGLAFAAHLVGLAVRLRH